MQRGFTLWFTGLSGAGKTTLSTILDEHLRARELRVEMLDGDVVRTHLSKGLGFSRADRDTNILRIGFVCSLLARNGVIALASAISPYRDARDQVRAMMGEGNFVEVYVATSLEECIRRDTKGLYAQALAGTIKEFTGISDPYEPPLAPEITVDTVGSTPAESAAAILRWLEAHDYVPTERAAASADALAPAAVRVMG